MSWLRLAEGELEIRVFLSVTGLKPFLNSLPIVMFKRGEAPQYLIRPKPFISVWFSPFHSCFVNRLLLCFSSHPSLKYTFPAVRFEL